MENVNVINQKQSLFDRPRIYREQLLTLDDLQDFKRQMIFEIKTLLKEYHHHPTKKWLKSYDVRKLLNISPGTLQSLRSKNLLPYTRIGGIIYYDSADIQKMLDTQKT